MNVSWDLDRNGSFETVGDNPVVSAAGLDGPGTILIPARAEHQTDHSALGQSAPLAVGVRVRNVAPAIADLALRDPLGGIVGVDIPFGITGLEYSAAATFTDAGTPDHQTAALNWGDGAIDQSHVFRSFFDAFGGAVGQLAHGHVFTAAGGYDVGLEVSDDDGGVDGAQLSVEIVSPEAAIGEAIAAIDALLGGVTDPHVRAALERARRMLAGGATGSSSDGALDKLAGGQIEAAIAKLREAIEELRRAQADGANVGGVIALLEQIVLALSAA